MNQSIYDLFNDKSRINKLGRGLPVAFEMAALEMSKGNPAVGVLREHILTGFFVNEFGQDKIKLLTDGNQRGYDVLICDQPISIKTVTGNGDVKVVWTVDPSKIELEIDKVYSPKYDILLVNIYWEKKKDSIFYIPKSVQMDVWNDMKDGYLNAKIGTNHRGISISKKAMKALKSDDRVLTASVNWNKSGLQYSPHERWVDFWKDI